MKNTIKKLYDSRAFWVIVSLIASLVFWIYVSSVETEEFKQTFRGVKVELVGETILRDSKNLVFIQVNDGSCFASIQLTFDRTNPSNPSNAESIVN